MPADPPTNSIDTFLEFWQRCYSATGNPLYVWTAVDWCRNEHPQRPLPNWCVDHLAKDAERITALMVDQSQVKIIEGVTVVGSIGKGRGRAPPTPKPSEMLHALGFVSKGKNAFKNAASEQRAIRAATQFALLLKTGSSHGEALKELMDWLGESDETNAKRLLRAGNRLLGASTRFDKSRKTWQ